MSDMKKPTKPNRCRQDQNRNSPRMQLLLYNTSSMITNEVHEDGPSNSKTVGLQRYRYWGIGQNLPVLGGTGIDPILFSVIVPNTVQTTVAGLYSYSLIFK